MMPVPTRLTVLILGLMTLSAHAETAPEPNPAADLNPVQQLATGYRFVEGPAVAPDGSVYFTDIPNARIHRHDPATGVTAVFREDSGKANGLMFDDQGRLIACEGASDGGARRVSRTETDGTITTLADEWQGRRLNSPNDLDIDALGGIYFTDPRYGKRADMQMDIEAVFYLAPDGTLTRVIHDLERPNGLILSPDGKTLYVADNAAGKLIAYDIHLPGQPTNPRRFSEMGEGLGGSCDGMSIDALGRVYATGDEGVYIFNPDGTLAELITTPERPSNCTLAPDGRTLYITARTSLYRAMLTQPAPVQAE